MIARSIASLFCLFLCNALAFAGEADIVRIAGKYWTKTERCWQQEIFIIHMSTNALYPKPLGRGDIARDKACCNPGPRFGARVWWQDHGGRVAGAIRSCHRFTGPNFYAVIQLIERSRQVLYASVSDNLEMFDDLFLEPSIENAGRNQLKDIFSKIYHDSAGIVHAMGSLGCEDLPLYRDSGLKGGHAVETRGLANKIVSCIKCEFRNE